jgi:ribosomal protein S18 acetylase RimI-like enzyme
MSSLQIMPVETPEQLAWIRELFVEYAHSLSFHICFSDFQKELDQLPGGYGPPSGRLLLALVNSEPAGCVALRPAGEGTGELKRLYVRPIFRGKGIGRRLTERVLGEARRLGYRVIQLDTLPSMKEAQALYRSLGFKLLKDEPPSEAEDEPIDMELRFA